MVVFDLKCSREHAFEGWFDDLADLESQSSRGLLECPVCGDKSIRRVPSGFAIAKKSTEPSQEDMARMLGSAMVKYVHDNFEDVGAGFAKEALKIHYGASESRNIRGVSTPAEEKMLQEEGVSFFKVSSGRSGEGEKAEKAGKDEKGEKSN